MLSASVLQIQLFLSTTIVSNIEGGIAIISYAERLYNMPISLLGTNFANISLVYFSNLKSKIQDDVQNSTFKLIIFSVPITIVTCIYLTELLT